MKTIIKRATAALLALLLLLAATACSGKPQEQAWSIPDSEITEAAIIDMTAEDYEADELVYHLTCPGVGFSESITADDVQLRVYPISDDETAAQPDAADGILVSDITLKMIGDEVLSLATPNDYKGQEYSYLLNINKDGMANGKYGVGVDVHINSGQSDSACSLISEVNGGDLNPTFEIALTNTEASAGIGAADITLDGAFENLQVSSVEGKGDVITINTAGEVRVTSAPYGYITLGENATTAGDYLFAMADLVAVDAYVDNSTFKFSKGVLSFDIVIAGAPMSSMSDEQMLSLISIDRGRIEGIKADVEKQTINVSVAAEASNIDSAIESLLGATVSINGAITGGNALRVLIEAGHALPSFRITEITKPSGKSNTYSAKANLDVSHGSISALKPEDITFDGDFEDAKITKLTENTAEGSYDVAFTFEGDDAEKTVFSGFVYIGNDKIKNPWGTPSAFSFNETGFCFETQKSAYKDVKDFVQKVDEELEAFYDVKDVAFKFLEIKHFYGFDTFTGIANSLCTAGAILSLFGLYDEPESQIDKVYRVVQDTNVIVKSIDTKVTDLQDQVSAASTQILNGVNTATLLAACNGWNSFKSNYIVPLEGTANTYSNNVRSSLVQYINGGHGGSLTLYFDKEGNLTVPSRTNAKYSADGVQIDQSKTIVIPLDEDSFPKANEVLGSKPKYSGKLVDAFKTDLADLMASAAPESLTGVLPEAIPEPTPEATPEPTPEATPEPTPEATPEVTPEPSEETNDDPDEGSSAVQLAFAAALPQRAEGTLLALTAANIPEDMEKKLREFGSVAVYDYIFAKICFNELTPAVMNTVQNQYTALCKAIIGDSSGSPVDRFNQIMYSKYNFQSEAEEDLLSMNAYLKMLVFRYGSFAAYAAAYNPGYDDTENSVGRAAKDALTYLKKNTGLHDPYQGNWCYPANRSVSLRVCYFFGEMGVNSNIKKAGSREVYEGFWDNGIHCYTKADMGSGRLIDKFYFTLGQFRNTNIVNSTVVGVIHARYESMGLSSKMSFMDYLSSGVISNPSFEGDLLKPMSRYLADNSDIRVKLLTKVGVEQDFPVNGSKSLMRTIRYTGKDDYYGYYPNQTYSIGPERAEYFVLHKEFLGDTYDFASGRFQASDTLLARAIYGESHWNWYMDESYLFETPNSANNYYLYLQMH